MIKTGLAIAALLVGALTARAADLPGKAPSFVAPSYATWSGFYVGINGGYGFGSSTWDVPAVNPKPKGMLAGATLGYNFQTGSIVWGLEGDFDYSGMKGNVPCGAGTCETSNSWLATARARIGYSFGSFLPYVTGGAAMGPIKASNSNTATSASSTRLGWTFGGGLEYALFSNWSVKGEYLYVNLGKFDCGVPCGGVSPDNVSFSTHIVRAGVNYRL